MQLGFLSRTPRGRCATALAYEHLKLPIPQTSQAAQIFIDVRD
jgi:Holliday junction DNA helicase RuvB